MNKNTFIFIGYWPDYEALFIELARSDDYDIISIDPRNIIARFIPVKWIPKPIRTWLEKRVVHKQLLKYKNDIFIFHETRTIIEALRDSNLEVDAHILMRNIINPESKTGRCVLELANRGYSVWSFDQADCNHYGFQPYKQFISACPGIKETEIKYDLTFVGRNKGREEVFNQLSTIAKDQNIKTYFDIKSDGKKKRGGKYKANISYIEYLTQLCSGACIVDIVQKSQTGLTMRPLEAMIYERKLLTNNPTILNEDFYHPNNILYFQTSNDLTDGKLLDFLQKKSIKIDNKTMQSYTLTHLLCEILKLINQLPGNTP